MKKNEKLAANVWTNKIVAVILMSLFAFSGSDFAGQEINNSLPVTIESSGAANKNANVALGGCQGFAGKWDGGSYGIMTLTQDGNSVSGSYEWKGTQSISGTVRGNTLRGKYYQPNYPEDRYKSGSVKFTLSADGNSWSGTWTDRNGNYAGTWSGTCIS